MGNPSLRLSEVLSFLFLKIDFVLANNADPDEMLLFAKRVSKGSLAGKSLQDMFIQTVLLKYISKYK